MSTSHVARIAAIGFLAASSAVAAPPGPIETTPFGSAAFISNPTWQLVDFHFFSALGRDYDEFGQTNQSLFPAPGYGYDVAHNGIIPGTVPVAGPYDNKLALALAAKGITTKSTFVAQEFTVPQAVYLDWIVVPTASAVRGSSPDFASGPIIPNSILPMVFGGYTFRDGGLVDANWGGQTDKTTDIPSVANPGDGWSHIPFFTAEAWNFDPSAPLAASPLGDYRHIFGLVDQDGNGWSISAPFSVVPEPALIGALSPIVLLVLRRNRCVGV